MGRRGDPDSIIRCIEEFSDNGGGWLKIAGDEKGAVLDDIVGQLAEAPVKLVVEFGCYVGYSACRMARLVRAWGGRVLSVEVDPIHVCIARNMLEFAGLSDSVDVHNGYSEDVIPLLPRMCRGLAANAIFMDQRGTRFHLDLAALEAQGMLAEGCVVAADNVLKPGAPHFLWRLQRSPHFSDYTVVSLREFAANTIEDWMSVARYRRGSGTASESAAEEAATRYPTSLENLAFFTDRARQRSCAGDSPGEVAEDEWAMHSQEVRRAYVANGICPHEVEVRRRSDGTPYVDWKGEGVIFE